MSALRRVVVTLFAPNIPAAQRMVRRAIGKHYRAPGGMLYRDRPDDWYDPAGFVIFSTEPAPALCGAAELEAARQEAAAESIKEKHSMTLATLASTIKETVAAAVGIETEDARRRAEMGRLRALWADGVEQEKYAHRQACALDLEDLRARFRKGEIAIDGIRIERVIENAERRYLEAADAVHKLETAKALFRDLLPGDHPLKVEQRKILRARTDTIAAISTGRDVLERLSSDRRYTEKNLEGQTRHDGGGSASDRARLSSEIANLTMLVEEREAELRELDETRLQCDAELQRIKADMLLVEV